MLEKVWRKGNLLHCWWECKLVQPLWRIVWRLIKKEIELPYDPAIPLLGMHTEETRSERDKYCILGSFVYCPAFPMMCSAYKLNKQGDNIQP